MANSLNNPLSRMSKRSKLVKPAEPVVELVDRERHSVAIDAKSNERLGKLADKTGLAKSQVVEWFIASLTISEATRQIKEAGITPRRGGRRKTTIF